VGRTLTAVYRRTRKRSGRALHRQSGSDPDEKWEKGKILTEETLLTPGRSKGSGQTLLCTANSEREMIGSSLK